jgi:hypothetical protein
MTGEIVEGKRTFIQRAGRQPFELPEGTRSSSATTSRRMAAVSS